MSSAWRFLGLFVVVVVLTACGRLGAQGSSSGVASGTTVAPTVVGAPWVNTSPVDPSIEPVSRSNPTAAAEAALIACGANRPKGIGVTTDFAIASMGLIPHARDVPEYANLWGMEPEIQTDKPAWVIQMAGRVGSHEFWADDPVCVVVDGVGTTYSPTSYGRGTKTVAAPTPPRSPTRALPPLAP